MPLPSTMTPIATNTLTAAAASVTFSNIPQTYTDFVVVINGYLDNNDAYTPGFTFNGDSGSNYSQTNLTGTGSIAKSSRFTNYALIVLGSNDLGWSTTAGNRNVTVLQVMNYANTTTNKTTICRSNQTSGSYPATEAEVGLWRSTSAITSINISGRGANFASTTTFNLYGVANASITNVAKATGGDSVYTDGTYWYHIFRSSGTFTPTQALTADYLVVAGGGGGSGFYGGGGGAGGMRCTVTATGGGGSLESALSLTAQAYTVTVGAGGAKNASTYANATSGSNSTFSTITSTGGGRSGNAGADGSGATGGSGGGGGGGLGTAIAGAAGTANQGFAGGTTTANNGGGGGGAGAAGSGRTGGNGVATSISGTSTTYAGGGGATSDSATDSASGGSGGGGASASSTTAAVNGTANLGGGGGGGRTSTYNDGGNGGSGIIVIRYSAA